MRKTLIGTDLPSCSFQLGMERCGKNELQAESRETKAIKQNPLERV